MTEEILYLQKDELAVISLPCRELAEHQIDGIRFIFAQYKKKKPGVILNFPAHCGKSVQVAVFIGAVYKHLKKPVIILYDTEQEREDWLEHFSKWTTIGEDEMAVDTPSAYVRRQVYIKRAADMMNAFLGRSWGVAVVEGDEFTKSTFKYSLKVDFKIWITAQDLKKDVELLRSLYSWIHPSGLPITPYLERKADAGEALTNNLLLSSLLEDILFTRRNLTPFSSNKRKHTCAVETIPVVSKKNKDATGKKIKRSKKYQETPSTVTGTESIAAHESNDSFNFSTHTSRNNGDNSSNSNHIFQNNTNHTMDCSKDFTRDYSNNDDFSRYDRVNLHRKGTDTVQDEGEEFKMDVESFIRDNDPLSDSNLSFSISNFGKSPQPDETGSPKEDMFTEGSLNFAGAVADIVRAENDKVISVYNNSIKENILEVNGECDLNQETSDRVQDTVLGNQSNNEMLVTTNEHSVSPTDKVLNDDGASDNQEISKSEEKSSVVSGGKVELEKNSEVIPGVTKETDSSFDSKMKAIEERALRKFKGSFLDNIF